MLHWAEVRRIVLRYLRLLGISVSLLLAATISGFLAMRYAIRGTVVVIPNLVGQTIDQADETLHRMSLKMNVLARKPDAQIPVNMVMEQDPIAGTRVKPDQMVRIIVSSGEKREAVPDVVGSSLRLAQLNLVRLGHMLGDVCRIHYSAENESKIVYQTPPPGDASGASTAVDVLLNLGLPEKSFVMPDLAARRLNETIHLFDKYQIKVESVTYRNTTGAAKGIILAQQPERGYQLTQQSHVRLVVSR